MNTIRLLFGITLIMFALVASCEVKPGAEYAWYILLLFFGVSASVFGYLCLITAREPKRIWN